MKRGFRHSALQALERILVTLADPALPDFEVRLWAGVIAEALTDAHGLPGPEVTEEDLLDASRYLHDGRLIEDANRIGIPAEKIRGLVRAFEARVTQEAA